MFGAGRGAALVRIGCARFCKIRDLRLRKNRLVQKDWKIELRRESLYERRFGRSDLPVHELAAVFGFALFCFFCFGSLLLFAASVLLFFGLGDRRDVFGAAADAYLAEERAKAFGGGGARHRNGQEEAKHFAQFGPPSNVNPLDEGFVPLH